jgi:hypothetical protein
MSEAITVFGKRSLAGVIPDEVRAGVDEADWWTLAEGYGIDDEDLVNAALDHFRIERLRTRLGEVYHVYYRPRGRRQIDLWRWTSPEEIAEEVAGARKKLKRSRKPALRRLGDQLARVGEVISLGLGWDQLDGMAVVLAYEIARWLAHVGDGCVRDHEGQWWALTRRGVYSQVGVP